MRLAVDVMGGDHGPEELLQGVKLGLAAESAVQEVHVVGPEDELRRILERIGFSDPRIRIRHASEVLTMEDKPVQGLRRKKDCSILRAVELVREAMTNALGGADGGRLAAAFA
jgi:glycerol-3-phosphate acyltransferase PlsX